MRGRKRTELSEEQKNQVQELVKQGTPVGQICKEVHIHFSKLKEYLDSAGIQTTAKAGRPKSVTPKPSKPKFKVEHKRNSIFLEQPIPITPSEYDLTLQSYENDEEIANSLRELLNRNITIEVHPEIELGGMFHPYCTRISQGDTMYPKEKHKFDLYIPEKNLIIICDIQSNKKEWDQKIGNRLRPNPMIFSTDNSYIGFLMGGCWNKLGTQIYYYPLDTTNLKACVNFIKKL